ncbi:MAG: hypothetical protein QOD10_5827 [Mycobacterium sp.]|jgi:hypothetical protein|nr:hypothetical protein [Mycobacterium sp.]
MDVCSRGEGSLKVDVHAPVTAYHVGLSGRRTDGREVAMFTFVQGARAMTAACVSVVAFVGIPATATADPTENQVNNDKLFVLLSGGYTRADCQAGKQYPEDPFLARLGCGRNNRPGGPNAATYSLYGNIADLNTTFAHYGASIPCPGTTDPGPIAWQGGLVKCAHDFYPHQSQSMVTWTKDADLVVVNAEGPDLASLYAWWLSAR